MKFDTKSNINQTEMMNSKKFYKSSKDKYKEDKNIEKENNKDKSNSYIKNDTKNKSIKNKLDEIDFSIRELEIQEFLTGNLNKILYTRNVIQKNSINIEKDFQLINIKDLKNVRRKVSELIISDEKNLFNENFRVNTMSSKKSRKNSINHNIFSNIDKNLIYVNKDNSEINENISIVRKNDDEHKFFKKNNFNKNTINDPNNPKKKEIFNKLNSLPKKDVNLSPLNFSPIGSFDIKDKLQPFKIKSFDVNKNRLQTNQSDLNNKINNYFNNENSLEIEKNNNDLKKLKIFSFNNKQNSKEIYVNFEDDLNKNEEILQQSLIRQIDNKILEDIEGMILFDIKIIINFS